MYEQVNGHVVSLKTSDEAWFIKNVVCTCGWKSQDLNSMSDNFYTLNCDKEARRHLQEAFTLPPVVA